MTRDVDRNKNSEFGTLARHLSSAAIHSGVLAFLSYDPRYEGPEDVVARIYEAIEVTRVLGYQVDARRISSGKQ